ncbi:unnamed protein product [Arctogadus glacialis]
MPNLIQATCANYRNHTAMHVPHHHSAAFMGVGKAGSACAGDPHRSASGGGRSLGVSQAFPLITELITITDDTQTIPRRYADDTQTIPRRYPDIRTINLRQCN